MGCTSSKVEKEKPGAFTTEQGSNSKRPGAPAAPQLPNDRPDYINPLTASRHVSRHDIAPSGDPHDPTDVGPETSEGFPRKRDGSGGGGGGVDAAEVERLRTNVMDIEVPYNKAIEEVYDGVHDGPVLGSGVSGLVRLITHRSTGERYAVKRLDLDLVETEDGLRQLREEIYIMCQLDHPNIVRLEEVYESKSEIYLVQEICLGGELFDRLDEQPDYRYTESQCARLVKQMLCSVRYIHSKGIIHRDLKLENFLFDSNSPDAALKMIDFGLSKHFKFGEVQVEAVGTPYTVAPEVIRGCYDERCDVWAVGVIAYLLLCGDPPFGGCGGPEPLPQVRRNILRGRVVFEPPEIWDRVSDEAKHFIKHLLVTNPNGRPTAREAQKTLWVKKWGGGMVRKSMDNNLNSIVKKSLAQFKEYSDMHKVLCEELSLTLEPQQVESLSRQFRELDTKGTGNISMANLKKVLMNNNNGNHEGKGDDADAAGVNFTERQVEDIFKAVVARKRATKHCRAISTTLLTMRHADSDGDLPIRVRSLTQLAELKEEDFSSA